VEVVLQAPADQPPSASLVPFTVRAEDTSTGEPAGFATGLLTVAVPVPVTGDLVTRSGEAHAYDLRLANRSEAAAPVRITVKLDPPAGSVTVEPAAVQIEPGQTVTAVVRARPARPFMGTPKPYFVLVSVSDAYDPDRPPLVKASGTGRRKPRVTSWMAGTAAIVLALAATAAVAFSGVRLPLPGSKKATQPPTAPAQVAAVTVSRPFAMIEVFPHRGADGNKPAADAAATKLVAQGMPVRVVDSLATDVIADEGAGFFVLLQDGFADVAAAQAYCTRWRAVAPNCRVTP
jgi:hypothetical protein